MESLANKALRHFRRQFLKRVDYPIVIAGLGRCGTTLVSKAISGSVKNNFRYIVDLEDTPIAEPEIIKTHSYPPITPLPSNSRVVFMFGEITNIILSTCNQINLWGEYHYLHTRTSTPFRRNEDLYESDQLKLEQLFDSWYRPQHFALLTLRYEALYNKQNLAVMKDFLGVDIQFPPWVPRQTEQNLEPKTAVIKNVYKTLDEKISKAEDCKVWPVIE